MNINDTYQGDRLRLSLSLNFILSLDFLSLFIYLSVQPFLCVWMCVFSSSLCVCSARHYVCV